MICAIYKSKRRDQTFLYVPVEKGLSEVPPALLDHFGPAVLVMKIAITAKTSLAQLSADKLLAVLQEQGFYLQLPPKEPNLLELHLQALKHNEVVDAR